MKYTRQMMKPGERFVLLRTGEHYVVDDNGALFNESRNRTAKLHGNCEVEPIKTPKREWIELTPEEGAEIWADCHDIEWKRTVPPKEIVKRISDKLKEKNGG